MASWRGPRACARSSRVCKAIGRGCTISGARPVQRSTLADANAHRPPAVFSELFARMVSRANRHLRRALGDTVYLIDASGLKLDRRSAAWARFSDAACGAKVHVIY